MLARSRRRRTPRRFPEKNSRKILYVLMCARIKRARGDTDGRKETRGVGCPGSEIEIRFSVDRYNPAPLSFRKRSEWASRSRYSHRDGTMSWQTVNGRASYRGCRLPVQGGREKEEMDRSIVPDVGRIMRLQITSRLRASAAKLTNQRSIVARSNSFMHPLNGSRDSCTFGKRPSAAI